MKLVKKDIISQKELDSMSSDKLLELLAQRFDPNTATSDEAMYMLQVIEKKKKEERTKLWDSDPLIWAVDNLGVELGSVKWSSNPGYENHEWDSRIAHTGKGKDWEENPCVDPIHESMLAIARYDPRVVVSASTGVGKSFSGAVNTLWWLWRHDPAKVESKKGGPSCKVVFYANKISQISLNIGGEIEAFFPKFKEMFPNAKFLRGKMAIYMDNRDESAREHWSARAHTAKIESGTDAAGGAKGSHAEFQMTIQEEASSADRRIVRSITDGAGGPGNIFVAYGNPLSKKDMLYELCTKPNTTFITASALDFPNVVLKDHSVIPGAISQENIDILLDDAYGNYNDPKFIRVARGRFPEISEHSIFPNEISELITCKELDEADIFEEFADDELEGYAAFYMPGPRMDYVNWCYVSCDIAGDSLTGDYHVAIFFDRVLKTPFGIIRCKGERSEFFAKVVKYCKKFRKKWRGGTDWPLLIYERNTHAPTTESVIRKYPRLYHPTSMDKLGQKVSKVVGWYTNKRSRIEIQERLKVWIKELAVDPARLYLEDLFEELGAFIGEVQRDGTTKYEAAPGAHDDTVMATGIALAVDNEHYNMQPVKINEHDLTVGTNPAVKAYKPKKGSVKKRWDSPARKSGRSRWQ